MLSGFGDPRVVLTAGLETCVVAYPYAEWLAFEERLSKLPQFDASVSMLRRMYFAAAVECELDRLGRLLVPNSLRRYAGLGRDAIWVGMGSHVELWDRDRYESLREEVLADPAKRDEMARRLAELGL